MVKSICLCLQVDQGNCHSFVILRESVTCFVCWCFFVFWSFQKWQNKKLLTAFIVVSPCVVHDGVETVGDGQDGAVFKLCANC